MMVTAASGSLHLINNELLGFLACWDPQRSDPTLQPDSLNHLLTQLNHAAELLKNIPENCAQEATFQTEILQYRHNVEKLQEILPNIHARLLAEKARLEGARTHAAAAAAWANASKKIL